MTQRVVTLPSQQGDSGAPEPMLNYSPSGCLAFFLTKYAPPPTAATATAAIAIHSPPELEPLSSLDAAGVTVVVVVEVVVDAGVVLVVEAPVVDVAATVVVVTEVVVVSATAEVGTGVVGGCVDALVGVDPNPPVKLIGVVAEYGSGFSPKGSCTKAIQH